MKLFAYVALVAGASALSLSQMSAGLVQQEMNVQLSAFEQKKGKKDDSDDEKDAVMEDFKKAIEAELAKDGDVDLDELYAIVEKLAKKYDFKLPKGWKKHIKGMFDYVDANGDGKVTGAEIDAVMKKQDKKDVQLEDPGDEFEAAIKAELEKDGNVDFDELVAIIEKIAKKYSYKLPKGWKVYVK
jgi:Ca2+-binding EF-hand superfamily protein